jgi:hypothetical protein
VNIECWLGTDNIGSLLFQSGTVLGEAGSSTPLVVNGTTPAKPSETSFEDHNVAEPDNDGHLFAATEAELVHETTVEIINTVAPSNRISTTAPKWQAIVKAGCRVHSEALFPNEVVKELNGATELTLENKVNPGKNIAVKTGTFGSEFRCGALTVVPLKGETKGKFKFVGYLDNATTPLVTLGSSATP